MASPAGFQHLLELGADPNVVFDDGGSVMHWAAGAPDPTLLEIALRYGGDPNLRGWALEQTPIFRSLASMRVTELLLDAGAEIDARDRFGRTPLLAAVMDGRFDVAHLLLTRGADYRSLTPQGVPLAERIARTGRRIRADHEQAAWLEKVVLWLAERGVQVPDFRSGPNRRQ